MFGKPYLTVHGLHIAAGEVDVVCPRVKGKVACVVAAVVESPAVFVGLPQATVAGDACLKDLHHRTANVELTVFA